LAQIAARQSRGLCHNCGELKDTDLAIAHYLWSSAVKQPGGLSPSLYL
jgi:hypothetical protein